MDNVNNQNGSRWWKIDFHAHTPCSRDYRDAHVTPADWVRAAVANGLDAVVVADHNSGEWIDRLKEAVKASGSRLVIIPGVEITVDDGRGRVHLLAVFDPSVSTAEVTAVLGACGIASGFGDHESCHTTQSIQSVATIIRSKRGLLIPAHVDGKQGLLHGLTRLNANLRDFLRDQVVAMEVCDELTFEEREDLRVIRRLAVVGGSDAHQLSDLGRHFVWVKMSKPTYDSLRIAFLDKDNCILPQTAENPNRTPDFYITSLSVSKFRTCGNDSRFPLTVKFSPYLTSLIGGRGTGKSTIIESLRMAFRKTGGRQATPAMKEKWDKFHQQVTRPESSLIAEFVFHGALMRIHWREDATGSVLEEFEDGTWRAVDAGDVAQRFPVDIFSQKQIFDLAENSRGLLSIVDESEAVNKVEWDVRWMAIKREYLNLCAKARELRDRREMLKKLAPEIGDLDKKISAYQEKGYGDTLQRMQVMLRQKHALEVDDELKSLIDELRADTQRVAVPDFPAGVFDSKDASRAAAESVYGSFQAEMVRLRGEIDQRLMAMKNAVSAYETNLGRSGWGLAFEACRAKYEQLAAEAKRSGISFDREQYERWVAERERLRADVNKLPDVESALKEIVEQIKKKKGELEVLRDELFDRRSSFLKAVVGENAYVRMSLVKYGDTASVEADFRKIFSLEEGRFVDSVYSSENHTGILAALIEWEERGVASEKIRVLLEELKTTIWSVAHQGKSGYQAAFDRRLSSVYLEKPSAYNEMSVYLPEDKLLVEYAVDGKFKPIEEGASAGQKSAAILSFLLGYGSNPIVIDQPEDDLDNELIMDLVVRQLNRNKNRRQMVIATHNPNIVVNGDSELIDVMTFVHNQVHCNTQDCIDSSFMRNRICQIMEGGAQAFKKRYKRLVKEVDDV